MGLYPFEDLLLRMTAASPPKGRIISLSYSLANPVYVLSLGRIRPDDGAFRAFSAQDIREFRNQLEEQGDWIIYRRWNMRKPDSFGTWCNRGADWLKENGFLADPKYELIRVSDSASNTEFGLLRRYPGEGSVQTQRSSD
jgi:hypothetical protein